MNRILLPPFQKKNIAQKFGITLRMVNMSLSGSRTSNLAYQIRSAAKLRGGVEYIDPEDPENK